jgi:hypothetical protein
MQATEEINSSEKETRNSSRAFDLCELRLRATGFWQEKSSAAELPLNVT